MLLESRDICPADAITASLVLGPVLDRIVLEERTREFLCQAFALLASAVCCLFALVVIALFRATVGSNKSQFRVPQIVGGRSANCVLENLHNFRMNASESACLYWSNRYSGFECLNGKRVSLFRCTHARSQARCVFLPSAASNHVCCVGRTDCIP